MIISPLAFLLSDSNSGTISARRYEYVLQMNGERQTGIVVESSLSQTEIMTAILLLDFVLLLPFFLFILGTDNILEQMLFECVYPTRMKTNCFERAFCVKELVGI